MTPDERAGLINDYALGCTDFIHALQEVPASDLDSKPDGEWCARDIAHHVADAELVRSYRLRQLLAQESPRLQSFDEVQFKERLHYTRPIETSIALFKAAIDSNLELLAHVAPEDWGRTGRHDEFGPFSLEDWLKRAAVHSHEHAAQLRRLAAGA